MHFSAFPMNDIADRVEAVCAEVLPLSLEERQGCLHSAYAMNPDLVLRPFRADFVGILAPKALPWAGLLRPFGPQDYVRLRRRVGHRATERAIRQVLCRRQLNLFCENLRMTRTWEFQRSANRSNSRHALATKFKRHRADDRAA
jgi:hypothetical protein